MGKGAAGRAILADVRLLLMLVGAVFVLMLVGFLLSALKWLVIVAAVVVAVGLLIGWRPSRTRSSTYR